MGLEFSGTIEEVGTESTTNDPQPYQKGDSVYGLVYGGAYAEYVTVNKRMLLRKPEKLSWEKCAAVPEVFRPFLCPSQHYLADNSVRCG